jgi:selenide, water dikinase
LDDILCGLEFKGHPNLLIGLGKPDDAAVYQISPEIALIQTLDFFTPIVDNPYQFGQIAAANALSDVYAMGGKPITAMNIVAFPIDREEKWILKEILRGGIERVNASGAVLAGGHSVKDDEMKYGLSVTGTVHPDKILASIGIQNDDVLILTKPLGTGIIGTAIKGKMASQEHIDAMVKSMITLNSIGSALNESFNIHAMTDITGFGLIGHLWDMIKHESMHIEIDSKALPLLPGALKYAAMKTIPGGAVTNRDFYSSHVDGDKDIDKNIRWVLYDAQTSGGLLFSVHKNEVSDVLEYMEKNNAHGSVIGRAMGASESKIRVY